jgi:hypothetical protein
MKRDARAIFGKPLSPKLKTDSREVPRDRAAMPIAGRIIANIAGKFRREISEEHVRKFRWRPPHPRSDIRSLMQPYIETRNWLCQHHRIAGARNPRLRLATASGISTPTGAVAEWLKAAVC